MNWLFILFPIILVAGQIVAHRWIKKVTNLYWFWLGISALYLIYVIVVSWYPHWNTFAHTIIGAKTPLDTGESKILSNVFLLNICPFLNFALPICLIADPSRKAARGFAPLAIISSAFVLMFDAPTSIWTDWTWEFIFLGNKGQFDLYFMGHLINLLLGVGIMLNTPKMGWKGMCISFGQIAAYFTYVGICKTITGCCCYTSGLSYGDYVDGGNYAIFAKVGIGMPWASIIFFSGLIIFLGAIMILWDFCKRNNYKYGNKVSKHWWAWYDYNKFANRRFWGNNLNCNLNKVDRIWTKGKK